MCPILVPCEYTQNSRSNLESLLRNSPQGQKVFWLGPSVQLAQVLPCFTFVTGGEAHQMENGCAQRLQHAKMSPPRPRRSTTSGALKHARKGSPLPRQSLRIVFKSSLDWLAIHAAWMSSQNPGCMITATNKGALMSTLPGSRSRWWHGDHPPMSCPTRMADTLLGSIAAALS